MHARMTLRDRVEMLTHGMQVAHETIRTLHAKATEDAARIAELEAEVARLRATRPAALLSAEAP